MPEYYRKRPVVIEAMRFVGDNHRLIQVYDWIANEVGVYSHVHGDIPEKGVAVDHEVGDLLIATLEGEMRCKYGDWVIRGVNGEFYPCKDDIFMHTYDPVDDGKNELPGMVEEMRKLDTKPMSPYEEMVKALETANKRKKKESE